MKIRYLGRAYLLFFGMIASKVQAQKFLEKRMFLVSTLMISVWLASQICFLQFVFVRLAGLLISAWSFLFVFLLSLLVNYVYFFRHQGRMIFGLMRFQMMPDGTQDWMGTMLKSLLLMELIVVKLLY